MKEHLLPTTAIGRIARLCLPLLLLVAVSCSEDDPADPGGGNGPTQPPPTGDVTQSITPTGGAVAATSQQGAIITVTVPANTVGSPHDFTISPQTPSGGAWLNTTLLPKNIAFFNAVGISVKAPNGLAIDDTHLLFFGDKSNPTLLPTGYVDSLRTLSTQVRGFGVSSDDPVGRVPRVAGAEIPNQIGAAAFTCAEHETIARQALNDLVANGAFDDAFKAAMAAGSAVSRAGCSNVDDWVTIATQMACDSLALALAMSGTVAGFGEFRQQMKPVLYWAAVARQFDPSCSGLGLVSGAMASAITDFNTFYNTELSQLTDLDFDSFGDLKAEAQDVHKLFTEAVSLGETAAATQLQNDLLYPTLISMRSTLYTLCRADTWHYPTSRLTSVGFYSERDAAGVTPPNNPGITQSIVYAPFTDEDVWEDLQLCATNLDVTTLTNSGPQLAQENGGGGSSPGSHTADIVIRTPSRGKIRFSGGIAGFTCWDNIAADNTIDFQLNNTTVLTLNRSGEEYLSTPSELDIQQMAQQAGVALVDNTRLTMSVRRMRTACDDRLWGNPDYEMLRIHMDIEGPGMNITNDLPSTIAAGDTVDVDIQVELVDQVGGKSFEPGVTVSLSALNGSVSPLTALTDANGVASFRVAADPETPAVNATSSQAADLFVGITAMVDGVTEQSFAQATIITCVVDGFLVAKSQEQLDAFAGVCRVERGVELSDDGSGTQINNLNALSGLTYAGEGIAISGTALTSLAGLEDLIVGNSASISIINNPNLTTIDALAQSIILTTTTSLGLVNISGNAQLTSIQPLEKLLSPVNNGSIFFLIVKGNPALTTAGLARVDTIPGQLQIEDNDALVTVQGFTALRTVSTLLVSGNDQLFTLSGLVQSTVSDSVGVTNNAALANLDGLALVTSLSDGCEISGNPELSSISGLSNLSAVGGLFAIRDNPKLCLPLPAWVAAVTAGSTDHTNNGTDVSCP